MMYLLPLKVKGGDRIKLKRLYVGNLPWSVRDPQLAEAFNKYPSVTSTVVIMDRMTGKSRGFGFVEMSDDNEAVQAVNEMNGFELEGRKLVVNEAKPREDNRH